MWVVSINLAMTIKNNFAILNNNVAFASVRRWQAHCVSTIHKKACKGLKPIVICVDCFTNFIRLQ